MCDGFSQVKQGGFTDKFHILLKNVPCCVAALFLWRNNSFLEKIPEKTRHIFVDEDPIAPTKLKLLREMIDERFPVCIDLLISFLFVCGFVT